MSGNRKNSQALAVAAKIGYSPRFTLLIRSDILAMLERFEEALGTLAEAEEYFGQGKNVRIRPVIARTRGSLMLHLGHGPEGFQWLAGAIAGFAVNQCPAKEGYTRFLLAMFLWLDGKTSAAAAAWHAAKEKLAGQEQKHWLDMAVLRQALLAGRRCRAARSLSG